MRPASQKELRHPFGAAQFFFILLRKSILSMKLSLVAAIGGIENENMGDCADDLAVCRIGLPLTGVSI